MNDFITYGRVGGDVKAFIGEVHRKALAFDPRARLVAGAFSIVPEFHTLTADTYNIPSDRRYDDYKERAEKESKRKDPIDFVIICTPNSLHYEVAKAFLEKGIHVVCEKPLCFTAKEGEELVRLAREKNLLFAVNYGYTGYPLVKVAKERIAKGKLGHLLSASVSYLQDWLLKAADPETSEEEKNKIWRLDPKKSGSSCCIGDIGTHGENLLHYLLGKKVDQVFCDYDTFGQRLDLAANVLLKYKDNRKARITCSQVALGHLNDIVVSVYGTKGAIEWHQQNPDHLLFTVKDAPTMDICRGTEFSKQYEAGNFSRLPSGHPEGLYEAFANNYRTIVTNLLKRKRKEALTDRDEDYPHGEEGLEGIYFINACLKSKEVSGWVGMNDSKIK